MSVTLSDLRRMTGFTWSREDPFPELKEHRAELRRQGRDLPEAWQFVARTHGLVLEVWETHEGPRWSGRVGVDGDWIGATPRNDLPMVVAELLRNADRNARQRLTALRRECAKQEGRVQAFAKVKAQHDASYERFMRDASGDA